MNFIQQLHERALEAAKRFKHAESDLIEIFQGLDETKGFIQFDCTSLFEYGIKVLGLSEGTTDALIRVARKSREVPELKEAVRTGKVTMSKAKKIASVITPENQESWLSKAQTLSKSALEKEVAGANPELAVPERARYVTDKRLELKLGVSEELMKKLERIKDLVSQKKRSSATFESALEELAELYLERNDPLRKAQRAKLQVVPGPVNSQGRSTIPAMTLHALTMKDGSQCTHLRTDGTRCPSRRWLQIHHKKPVSEGGQNGLSNLTTLCFQHHRFVHARELQLQPLILLTTGFRARK
jgi:5-methylcytosine-specific restriction endonuclease McrA